MAKKDYTAELKAIQAEVKALGAKRDTLIRDAGAEERKIEESVERLRELGVKNPEKLSVADLEALRDKTEADLGRALAAIEAEVAEGARLMAEYEAAAAS